MGLEEGVASALLQALAVRVKKREGEEVKHGLGVEGGEGVGGALSVGKSESVGLGLCTLERVKEAQEQGEGVPEGVLLWEMDSVENGEAEGKGLCELLRAALRVPGNAVALKVASAGVPLPLAVESSVGRDVEVKTPVGVIADTLALALTVAAL